MPDAVPDMFLKGVTTLFADRAGNVWIAAGGRMGVVPLNGRFRSYNLSIGSIACIFEDAGGTLWVGGDDGLSLLSGDRFIPVTHGDGFPANVRTIVEDDLGFLWVGVASGILRLDRRELVEASTNPGHQLRYRLFNAADGVAGAPMGEGRHASVRASTGKLWFLTTSGVTVVDPHNLGESRPMPPVRIETVTADSRTLDPTPGLRLAPRTSHLQIAFSVLTLTDPAQGSLPVSPRRLRSRLGGRRGRAAGLVHQPAPRPLPVPRAGQRRRRRLARPWRRLGLRRRADVLPDDSGFRRSASVRDLR